MKNFINEKKINDALRSAINPSPSRAGEVIEKARSLKGLSLSETAVLLQSRDSSVNEEIFRTAREVKEAIYGNRIVLFAPLYLSNFCPNNCLYCGFRSDNRLLERKRLTLDEIRRETEILEMEGHKRLLVVASEDPEVSNVEFLGKAIKTIYETKKGKGSIRRVNVNIAPLSTEDFRKLKAAGIGTYQLFQETYHEASYAVLHPNGPKSDFMWRLYAMDRAQEAGIDDVGIGILFGLYDHKFEVLALLEHSAHLEEKFGVGPHTISVPRIRPAFNTPLSNRIPYPVDDENFKKTVAILRLAVPYTGIILSTREEASLRDELISLGVSQISAGSRTNPGAYAANADGEKAEQFELFDARTQLEVVKDIVKKGLFPSFCTACYRSGRTGSSFMDLAKPGDIKDFCLPNCLLTFKEYVIDYGDEELKNLSAVAISRELAKIGNPGTRQIVQEDLKRIEKGERDIFM